MNCPGPGGYGGYSVSPTVTGRPDQSHGSPAQASNMQGGAARVQGNAPAANDMALRKDQRTRIVLNFNENQRSDNAINWIQLLAKTMTSGKIL